MNYGARSQSKNGTGVDWAGIKKRLGGNIQPVFQWIIANSPKEITGPIEWNFEKFLISKQGKLVRR
jgi:glutathione peroxidase-family protein